jgi:hypothetical protein
MSNVIDGTLRTRAIHPAAIARANKLGCNIVPANEGYKLLNLSTLALSVETFDMVAEATEELSRVKKDGVEWEELKVVKKLNNTCGVMNKNYHDKYSKNPHGPGSGDEVDIALRNATNNPGTKQMNLEKLKEIMNQNEMWNCNWETLNPGMQRMISANRIRGFLRNNAGTVVIGEETSRFGVVQKVK